MIKSNDEKNIEKIEDDFWVTHPYIRYGNLKHSKTVSMI